MTIATIMVFQLYCHRVKCIKHRTCDTVCNQMILLAKIHLHVHKLRLLLTRRIIRRSRWSLDAFVLLSRQLANGFPYKGHTQDRLYDTCHLQSKHNDNNSVMKNLPVFWWFVNELKHNKDSSCSSSQPFIYKK